MAEWYRREDGDVILQVRLQPRASRDRVVGVREGALWLALTAPPVEGKANAALCAFIAKAMGVPKSKVTVIRGERGRNKQVRVQSPPRSPEILIAPS